MNWKTIEFPSPGRQDRTSWGRFYDVWAGGLPLVDPEDALELEIRNRAWMSSVAGILRSVGRGLRRGWEDGAWLQTMGVETYPGWSEPTVE
jgi:hypothetical protein